MAKITAPLFGLDARGQVGKAIVYSIWKGVNYVRRHVVPSNPNSAEQQAVRGVVYDASIAWKTNATVGAVTIDAAYKLAYTTAAAGQAYSGFNLFIRDCMTMNLVDTNGVKSYDGTLEIASAPGETE